MTFATTGIVPVSPPLDLLTLIEQLQALTQPDPRPLSEWRDAIRNRYQKTKRSTRSRVNQAVRELCGFLPYTASTRDLTPEAIGLFAAHLATSHRSGATQHGLLRGLRAACNFAVRSKWLRESPFRDFDNWPDETSTRKSHHSRREIDAVLTRLEQARESWQGHRLYALTAVYAFTGLRLREALRLRVEDLDFDQGVLFVERTRGRGLKTRASAAPVPMPRMLTKILRAWLRRNGSEWVFPGLRGKGPWLGGAKGYRPTDRVKAAGHAAGVEGFTPQSLRHSLATHLRNWWGLDERQIQLVLRHTTTRTQRHYVHPDVEDLAACMSGFRFDGSPPARPSAKRKRSA